MGRHECSANTSRFLAKHALGLESAAGSPVRVKKTRQPKNQPVVVPSQGRRKRFPANARIRRAKPVPVRAARAYPAPSFGSSRRARRAGLRIRAASGAHAGRSRTAGSGAASGGTAAGITPGIATPTPGASGNSCPSRSSTIRPSAFSRRRCMSNSRIRESSDKPVKVRLRTIQPHRWFSGGLPCGPHS